MIISIMLMMMLMMMMMMTMMMMMMMMMVYNFYSYTDFQQSLGEQFYDAAKSGDVEALERLLDEGADIEYVDSVREVIIICLLIYFLLNKWSILCI